MREVLWLLLLSVSGFVLAGLVSYMFDWGDVGWMLMVIPMAVPILIFGAGALSPTGAGGIALAGAISLAFAALAPFAAGAAIRAAREG